MMLFIGTYTDTTRPQANDQGIMSCAFDQASGCFSQLRCAASVVNPSWVHLADGGRQLFAVSECVDQPGQVHGFEVDAQGELTHRASQSSQGLATCHLTTTAKHLYAASYLDGRLTAFARQQARVEPSDAVIEYVGSGPIESRQKTAHAHQAIVAPHGRWLYVCDLGSDRIWQHDLNDAAVSASAMTEIPVPAGAGPRHLVFHPTAPIAWCVCELTPTILTFDWDPSTGALTLRDTLVLNEVPALAHVGATAAIHLHPWEKLLGISERAGQSIGLFTADPAGTLTFHQHLASDEQTPRDFAFSPDGRWLIAAWQHSHAITSHAIGPDLKVASVPSDRVAVHSPVCLATR